MSIISTEDQKAHMSVDFDDDDALIAGKIEAAESYVELFTGRKLADFDPVPGALKEAIRILAAHFYENREATSADRLSETPFGFLTLVQPFRDRSF